MDPALVSILSTWMNTFKNTIISVLPWVLPLSALVLSIKIGILWAVDIFKWLGLDKPYSSNYGVNPGDLLDDDDPRASWNNHSSLKSYLYKKSDEVGGGITKITPVGPIYLPNKYQKFRNKNSMLDTENGIDAYIMRTGSSKGWREYYEGNT